jgi:hypothetical protein
MILDNIRVMFPRSLIKVENASCCDMMRGCSDLSSGGSSKALMSGLNSFFK